MKYIFGLLMLALTFVFTSPPCFAIQGAPTTENTSIEKKVTALDTVASLDFEVEKIADLKGGLPIMLSPNLWIATFDFQSKIYNLTLALKNKKNTLHLKNHWLAWNDNRIC